MKTFLKKKPKHQKNDNFQLMNLNLWFVLVNKFQLLSSSPSNLWVTSSSMMLATPVLTYSRTSLNSNSLWKVAAEIFFPPSNSTATEVLFSGSWEPVRFRFLISCGWWLLGISWGERMRLSFLEMTLCRDVSLCRSIFGEESNKDWLEEESVQSYGLMSGEGLNPESPSSEEL